MIYSFTDQLIGYLSRDSNMQTLVVNEPDADPPGLSDKMGNKLYSSVTSISSPEIKARHLQRLFLSEYKTPETLVAIINCGALIPEPSYGEPYFATVEIGIATGWNGDHFKRQEPLLVKRLVETLFKIKKKPAAGHSFNEDGTINEDDDCPTKIYHIQGETDEYQPTNLEGDEILHKIELIARVRYNG